MVRLSRRAHDRGEMGQLGKRMRFGALEATKQLRWGVPRTNLTC